MKKMSRRTAITAAGAGLGVSVLPAPAKEAASTLEREIRALSNVSGHEHWGSIDAIGHSDGGFNADLIAEIEPKDASLIDVLFDPYSGMGLGAMGVDRHADARKNGCQSLNEWWRKDPAKAWPSIRSMLAALRSTGWYACLAEGLETLYETPFREFVDHETTNVDKIIRLDQTVRRHYRNLMQWYEKAYRLTSPARKCKDRTDSNTGSGIPGNRFFGDLRCPYRQCSQSSTGKDSYISF